MKYFILPLLLSLLSCSATKKNTLDKAPYFSPDQVKNTIAKRGEIWGAAIQSKNIELLKELYAADAHYLPDDGELLHGNAAILKYWEAAMPFMNGLKLNMETLEGTKEVLYETGTGVAKVMNNGGEFDNFKFKYTNVWRLESDGVYRVVIDMFNNFPRQ